MSVVEITPTDNVYISQYYSNTNFNSSEVLFTGKFDRNGDAYRSLLKFSLDDIIPPGAIIQKAILKLFVCRKDRSDKLLSPQPVRVHINTNDFSQNTVTWNNAPVIMSTSDFTYVTDGDVRGLIKIDITNIVVKWFYDIIPNNGITLIGTESLFSTIIGYSVSEEISSDQSPILVIEYNAEGPYDVTPYSVNRIYVANFNSNDVSVIDGNSNTVLTTIPVGDLPCGIGVNSETNGIYVTNFNSSNVSVIDGNSNTVLSTIKVDNQPCGIGVNLTKNQIYVSNYYGKNLSVIDGNSNKCGKTISIGDSPSSLNVNSATNRIYVLYDRCTKLSVIDVSDLSDVNDVSKVRVLTMLPVASVGADLLYPNSVGVNSATNRIYVASYSDNKVLVISGFSNKVIDTIVLKNNPLAVGVNSVTNQVYVARNSGNNVSVIDGNTNAILANIPVGNQPGGIGVNSATNQIYVANYGSGNVSVIDGNINKVVNTIQVGELPTGIGINL